MNILGALEALTNGAKVKRDCWDKDTFVKHYKNKLPLKDTTIVLEVGTLIFHSRDICYTGWAPTREDVQAKDWVVCLSPVE